MRLRDATEADLPAIAAILNAEIAGGTASWTATPKTPETMRDWMAARHAGGYPVLVAEQGGSCLGYGSYGPFRAGEGYAGTVEHSVYVARDARRRGIASALLSRLIDIAARQGYRCMVGGISADQPASLALHRKLGFVEQGRLFGVGYKRGRPLDLVLMVRVLP